MYFKLKFSVFYPAIIVIFLMLLTACDNKKNHKMPSKETIENVKSEISILQSNLPIEGGLGMIITSVDYDDATNTIRYKYMYTVSGASKPSDTQIKEAKKMMISLVKSLPKEMKLLENGISFHYDYYSIDNEYLYSVDITSDDI